MRPILRDVLRGAARAIGVEIAPLGSHAMLADTMLGRRSPIDGARFGLQPCEERFYNFYIAGRDMIPLGASRSQLGQDLWAAYLTDAFERFRSGERSGFFVEFGAFDGETLSNTFLLERTLNWDGILAEPNPIQYQACKKARSCVVDPRCVWHTSGENLRFNMVDGANELGTIAVFEEADFHRELRTANSRQCEVVTVSLRHLLEQHAAPKIIDYVSIDTEGSEYQILQTFPFDAYQAKVISVEHNFTRQRKQIAELLTKHGYARLSRSVDYVDDIFVNRALVDETRWR
jgi:FkbM family methyltransferase